MSITAGQYLYVGESVGAYVGNNGVSAGMVRFNTNTQHLEAYDGSTWIRIANNQHVSMTQEAVDAIHWARLRISEEERLKSLAEKHPGVADAITELKRASEQLEIMVRLVNQD
jgi:hypothetical protein